MHIPGWLFESTDSNSFRSCNGSVLEQQLKKFSRHEKERGTNTSNRSAFSFTIMMFNLPIPEVVGSCGGAVYLLFYWGPGGYNRCFSGLKFRR
jgi:ABC-type Co2+ transport system permease subunit